jgi:hypothetical protein
VPANKGRRGPRPRRPGSARLRIPSVGGLRQAEKERTPTLPKVDLVRTTDGSRRLSNKITIYGWSTRKVSHYVSLFRDFLLCHFL